MADNVDISLKLGTEADLSSAISAGARAGAAFAAAAQSAVNSIVLTGSVSSRAFQTQTTAITQATRSGITEARHIGYANTIVSDMLQKLRPATGGGGGMLPPPPRQNLLAASWPQDPNRNSNVVPTEPYYKQMLAINDNTRKSAKFIEAEFRVREKASGGSGGGGGANLLYHPIGGIPDRGQIYKNMFFQGLGTAKLAEEIFRPIADYFVATNLAGYQAKTARSARGYRNESLARDLAFLDLESSYGGKGAMALLTGAGAILGGFGGAAIGGFVGGIADLLIKSQAEDSKNRLKETFKQQEKTLSESLKRSQNAALFGSGYNTSYQEAIGNMGIGITEESISAMSSNALTFRGRQAFGQVGIHEYTMLAQVPNYFAALEAGITDPETLHKLLAQDLANIGDPSYASYIASQLGGVGLGTYAALQNPSYYFATNSVNSRVMRGANIQANSVIAGYVHKNALNEVLNTELAAGEMVQDAYGRPQELGIAGKLLGWKATANTRISSMFYNGERPTQTQYDQAVKDVEMAKQAALRNDTTYTGNTYVIEVNVDGNNVETAKLTERDFVMGGMSYAVGGN